MTDSDAGPYSFELRPPRVYERLPGGGQAVYMLDARGSRIIVSEVRVNPGLDVSVNARHLRERSPSQAVRAFRDFLAERMRSGAPDPTVEALKELAVALGQEAHLPAMLEQLRTAEDPWRDVTAKVRRSLFPREQRLAMTAAMYVVARMDGARAPNEVVAKQQGRSASLVRDDLKRARDAGLLTAAGGRGLAGGELTDKALAIIAAMQAPQREKGDDQL